MPQLNDRRAIESALPSRLFLAILRSVWEDQDLDAENRDLLKDLIPLLEQDIGEAIAGGDVEKRKKRLNRAVNTAFGCLEGRSRAIALLALTYWISDVIGQGLLVLHEGSPFERAYTAVVQAINNDPENTYLLEAVDKSAEKNARRLGERLASEGYFRG